MNISDINFLAVAVSALSSFGLGGLWYSPLLFGVTWMKETGITEEQAKQQNMAKIFGLAFIANVVIALTLGLFIGKDGSLYTGILYGFLAGFSWVAMSFAVNDLFEHRSFKLFAINAGYHTVAFTIMGGILGAWR